MNNSALRFGHVTEYDPSRHMARVEFPDMGIVSNWLPILTHNTLKNHDETHIDIGEHVACMMSGQGSEIGVILGAFYDDKNPPRIADPDVRAVSFDDGVRVLYNRKTHELVIDSPESVLISSNAAAIESESISLSDNVALSGTITLTGNITLSGSVSCPGYCHCGE